MNLWLFDVDDVRVRRIEDNSNINKADKKAFDVSIHNEVMKEIKADE